jgi:sulfane dehydrogenase subunit SoxC
MSEHAISRRDLIAGVAGVVGGAVIGGAVEAGAQQKPSAIAPVADPNAGLLPIPDDATKLQGAPTSAVGARSRFAQAARTPTGEVTGTSFTPLQNLTGTITPADLHFERHHAGVPLLDPSRHELVVHGEVTHPLSFTLADIQRFPQVTRTYFIECSGNSRSAYRAPKPEMTPQIVAGMTGNSEWTGVPLRVLLEEAGTKMTARWILAEGGDASLLARSIPMEKALDDAMIVWAQNGEPIRPEQGYPMRLLVPGFEGNANVKWLRRLEVGERPWMTRWETSKYTDPLPNGTARQFSFEMDAKSVITKGWWPISGLAWSGRGKITRVEVSVDNGKSWSDATLHVPALAKAHTRFTHMWEWTGSAATLLSRATDQTGYVQPTRAALIAVRGAGTDYHFNQIVGWSVKSDGHCFFHGES